MTVWVFGASYAEYYEGLHDQWMQRVAAGLGTDLQVYSVAGASSEYTYYNFNSVRQNIKEKDVVIIPLTTTTRRWFFKDYPHHSAQPVPGTDFKDPKVIYDPTGYPEIDEALQMYEEHLNHLDVFNTYLLDFLYNVNYLTKQKNLHTIILESYWDTEYFLKDKKTEFPYLHFSIEKLLSVSLDEYSKEYLIQDNFSTNDKKVNHLLRTNHIILADKILDNIKYNKPIDLSRGFAKHLVKIGSFTDPEFVEKEMFNRA